MTRFACIFIHSHHLWLPCLFGKKMSTMALSTYPWINVKLTQAYRDHPAMALWLFTDDSHVCDIRPKTTWLMWKSKGGVVILFCQMLSYRTNKIVLCHLCVRYPHKISTSVLTAWCSFHLI